MALIVWLAPMDHVTMLPKNVKSRATTAMLNSHDAPPSTSSNMSLSASVMPVTMLTSSVLIDARMPNVANMYTARIAAPARMIILGTSRLGSLMFPPAELMSSKPMYE